MSFGEVWRESGPAFWDGMWGKHKDSPMTKRLSQIAMDASALCEVGCGHGHFLQSLIDKGWRGQFIGFEMSKGGCLKVAQRCIAASIDATIHDGDFLEKIDGQKADVAICRGVVQHQAHWMPMTFGMLLIAPVVVLGIGYVSSGEYHVPKLQGAGHYDVHISPVMLEREARAVGLKVKTELFDNQARHCKELLAILERA